MKKLIPILIIFALFLTGCVANLTEEEAKTKAEDFINDVLMAGGPIKATVKEVTKEDGLFKIVVQAGDQLVDSYLTPDGKLFFPQAMNIEEMVGGANGDTPETPPAPEPTPVEKQDKANVEVFVMSHCPYGTQIEKGILPVLETLGDKVDFELKFCDYAMHGEKELDEQLNQLCIQEQGRDELIGYLKCFLKEGKGEECVTESGVDKGAMESCVAGLEKEFNVKADFADESTWRNGRFPLFAPNQEDATKYGVTGSPTLIINGQKAQSGRDSVSLLNAICGGFTEPPEECSTELDSASPSPGFGFEAAGGGNTAAACGG